MTDWIIESMNHKAVYRTAPATPGLLNMYPFNIKKKNYNVLGPYNYTVKPCLMRPNLAELFKILLNLAKLG